MDWTGVREIQKAKLRAEAMALPLTKDEQEFLVRAKSNIRHAEDKLKALIYHIIENNKKELIDDIGIPIWKAYGRYHHRAYLEHKDSRKK